MKLRRLATAVAATTALVLAGATTALAHHAEPDRTLDGNVKSCEGLIDGFYGWEASADLPGGEVTHTWWKVTVAEDLLSLDVMLTDSGRAQNAQLGVLVKGGDKTSLFLSEPGEDLVGLFAPFDGNSGPDHPEISNYTICKVKKGEVVPPGEEDVVPPGEEDDVPPGEEDVEEEGEEDNGMGGGEPTDEPTPEPTDEPAPVPTAVPAGTATAGFGAGAAGIAALVAAFFAGAAVIVRRRFLHDS